MGTAARKPESAKAPRGTRQEVVGAPAHRVVESVDGTLHSHPRPVRSANRVCRWKMAARSFH